MTEQALIDQAMAALRAGAAREAVAAIVGAPSALRNTQAAQRTLAAALAQNDELVLAQAAINRALDFQPIEPATRALAGRIALDLKQPANAFVQFDALVQIAPQQAGFWRYLWDAASTEPSLRRALQLTESLQFDVSADLHVAWAVTRALADCGRVTDALMLTEKTVIRHPQASAAQWMWVKRLSDEAPLTALAELARVPLPTLPLLDADAVDAALWLPELFSDDNAVTAWRERHSDGLHRLATALPGASLSDEDRRKLVRHTAFHLAYHGRDDLALQCARGDLLCALMQPVTPASFSTDTDLTGKKTRRLRVGFASKHIRDCTVGQYFKHFLTDLSDERVAVHIYACGKADAFTDDVQSQVDQLTRFDDGDGALVSMANAMINDQLDVLIYPEIGMEPIIEKLAAMRLAPLQCALWGHPVTTGLPTIDVFFSAAALEPEGAAGHYRERLHLLPGLGTCYPTPPAASTVTRAELGLPASGSLIVCAQSPFKWSPQFTRTVAAILQRSSDARLVVFDGPAGAVTSRMRVFHAYLAKFFAPLGIDVKSRVIHLPQQTRADFLAVLAACDVALDTFGFSGGNTSLDAFSVGLPVVTLPGEFMRGRQTIAMLKTMQSAACDTLIASDEAVYVQRVANLLESPATLAATRSAIRKGAHKLFNDPAPVAALSAWLMQASKR